MRTVWQSKMFAKQTEETESNAQKKKELTKRGLSGILCFSILLFPQAGPDIKYLLGFIRTQLSTTVTIALVFGPKVSNLKLLIHNKFQPFSRESFKETRFGFTRILRPHNK